jgi:hypothetical protein
VCVLKNGVHNYELDIFVSKVIINFFKVGFLSRVEDRSYRGLLIYLSNNVCLDREIELDQPLTSNFQKGFLNTQIQ